MTKKYSEKLKDPRWQRKRLEILERDGWTCCKCGSNTETLHVHHVRYLPGREPWDYPPEFLMTLCEGCHQDEYDMRKDIEADLLAVLAEGGFFYSDLEN